MPTPDIVPPYVQEVLNRPQETPIPAVSLEDEVKLFSGFMKTDRTAVIIDGANAHAACSALQYLIDYSKFRDVLQRYCDVRYLYFFTAVPPGGAPVNQRLRSQVDWMSYNGYRIIKKDAKTQFTSDGVRVLKGNMDTEINVCALEHCRHNIDHVVLSSGDGDFRPLVEALQQRGQRVSVISTMRTNPQMVAPELRRQADWYIDLFDLKPIIERIATPVARSLEDTDDAN